ncbi:MAG: GDSL-type esterase/lipase family protein [Verrucomicrobiota bacterium]
MEQSPQPSTELVTNTALIPVPKLEQDAYDWHERHQHVLDQGKEIDPTIVLIGDSITHFWGGRPQSTIANGPQAWKKIFQELRVLNMGFGWDRIQNVLWRLNQGEFDGLAPKWIILNIGTNNFSETSRARANTPEEIAEGILHILNVLQTKSPTSKIVVMGIFPRDLQSETPLRKKIKITNERIKEGLEGLPQVQFLDIGDRFLSPDGTLPLTMMYDGTHLTDEAYHLWAEALMDMGIA